MKNYLLNNLRPIRSRALVYILLAVFMLLLVTCAWPRPEPPPATEPLSSSSTPLIGETSEMEYSETLPPFQLSEGDSQPQLVEPLPFTTGEPLSDTEIHQILARLPQLTSQPGDQVDFRLPTDPIPPPLTGETIEEPFPPPVQPTQPPSSAVELLEVVRYAPNGEISIAPFVNITFSQPMVPIAPLSDLAEKDIPVRMKPPLAGTWRWLGTKTLTFEYDSDLIDRLPKATEFRITIPAGTKSAIGGVLESSVEWTFTTPPPKMTISIPYDGPQPLEPVFLIAFDQRINPNTVLDLLSVTENGESISVRMASQTELATDKNVTQIIKNLSKDTWLAFKSVEPLSADSNISIEIPQGTPSAEGPLVTLESQAYSFRTYAPMQIVEHGCSWSYDNCPPLSPFYIRFNNPVNADVFKDNLISIKPELPGVAYIVSGDTISIQGATRGQTTYTVEVNGNIQDIFGQTLGKNKRLTFKVGSAEPALTGPEQAFITLDPAAPKPIFSVYSINYNKLGLKIYSVQPKDWQAYKLYLREYQNTDKKIELPGSLVLDKTLKLDAPSDTLFQVDIDLAEVLDGRSYGQFIIVVEPPRSIFKEYPYWQTVNTWVQVTQIGLDAFNDHSQMVAWTTALKDGSPLEGVLIQGEESGKLYQTDQNGIIKFAIPDGASYIVASKGVDVAMLPRSPYLWDDISWNTRPVDDELRWYVFDDRQMYKPGEEVHIKGWLRRIGGKQNGDVGWLGNEAKAIIYKVIESQGNELGNGKAEVNKFGGFDFVFTIPDAVNLGSAQVTLETEGSPTGLTNLQYYHSLQIQEFRRPEFEVSARNETSGPYFAGGSAVAAVEAKYYAGGALPDAEVTWQVSSTPSNYQPPNWSEFTFGYWQPWWWFYENNTDETIYETFTGRTDASGNHYLKLDFNKTSQPRPLSVFAEATVMDVNRQAWAGSTTFLVHPADLYVGLRSERYFVDRGTPLKINFIVTDLDGKPVVDRPVEIRSARLQWKYQENSWQQFEVDIQTCKQGSTLEPGTCTFETPLGGQYRITAQVTDSSGRRNQSQLTRWVSGGEQPPARNVELETVTLIPDKETYQPGDVAHILVQSPFNPAEGLLTISRSGILSSERFTIDDSTITLDIPIEDRHIPNLIVQVDLTGSSPRLDEKGEIIPSTPPRPAYASGTLTLSIPPLKRTLNLQVTPALSELEPGGETTIKAILKDANGKPVSDAEIAIVVVDEAVLALTNYQVPDPVSIFYAQRSADLTSLYSRASIVLADPQALIDAARANQEEMKMMDGAVLGTAMPMPSAPMEMAAAPEGAAPPSTTVIRVRLDFNPLAVFAPVVHTDSNGQASVSVKLPDNLTRYRIIAVAVDNARQFGTRESNITARLPLMVRPSAPRFLNFGDQFELPVVLQNQTDNSLVVDVAIRTSNIELTGVKGLRITVPARNRLEVRFPAAAQMAGTARLQVAAVSGDYADAATIDLPVYTPASTEAFATYGVVDNGAVFQPVAAPEDVFPQYGGLEINTSSTALQALTDAVLYLVAYPFECSEQLASRILAIASLRDVLTAFEADGLPSPEEMESAVQRDITRLQGLQNYDGGFPYWRRGQESIPFNTIHAAHAIQRAEQKGFEVPQEMKQPLLTYLGSIEDRYPSWYSQQTRWALSSYALFVRQLMGDRDPAKARALINEAGLENLGLESVGWLWPVLQDDADSSAELKAIRIHINNRVVETAGAANFTTDYSDQTYLLLSSDRRTDAILLDALITDNPQSDLIPKLVNGLLAHREKGRWGNTQENVFVLLALDKYFNTYETQTPDFVANIWLGDTFAGSHEYHGRTTERRETLIPMSYLVENTPAGSDSQNLILSKEGTGRLYYRLGLRYTPTSLDIDALDMGFVVQRTYEAVDDPQDVKLDDNGIWHIKAGARVRIRIQMVANNRRYHVALVDPLPAGLEIVNPLLSVSGNIPQDPSSPDFQSGWWWWGPWFEHQNLRDERAEAFTSLLWDGVYQYTYLARATTPGRFVVPPAKAEEMYSPEVFGRSSSNVVIVE